MQERHQRVATPCLEWTRIRIHWWKATGRDEVYQLLFIIHIQKNISKCKTISWFDMVSHCLHALCLCIVCFSKFIIKQVITQTPWVPDVYDYMMYICYEKSMYNVQMIMWPKQHGLMLCSFSESRFVFWWTVNCKQNKYNFQNISYWCGWIGSCNMNHFMIMNYELWITYWGIWAAAVKEQNSESKHA